MPRKVKLKEPKYTIAELFKEIKRSCEIRGLENGCLDCPLLSSKEGCSLTHNPEFYDLRSIVPRINKHIAGDLPF